MNLQPPIALASPLAANQNATLVFSINATGGTVDSFGNYIPNSTTTSVSAIMHQSGDRLETQLGADMEGILMRGRCTSPKLFPSTVKQGMKAQATIEGVSGVFTLLVSSQNPYTDNGIGESFTGVFLRESA